ncbi:sucrase ferredoxin [Aquipuribacter nitratireducens]|uniref:Sucrase ferredoxin n=1 Tax=Aquipuribacter nitratireducens TaxID=650104 RepID=A0ABW0GSC0_9MICO
MSASHRPPRCADAAERRGDPLAGSAVPVARWLLVEQPGPWGREALTQSRLDVDVAAHLGTVAREVGARVLLVRRHGRAGRHGHGRRHWAVADSRPGSESLRWGRYDDERELLDLDPATLVGPPAAAGPAETVYLVCTHARHDTCCAVRGRGVAAALDDVAPGRVWECSHVGGCRFAANVVVLPHGLYYGRVGPASAPALVEATDHGHVVADLLRGRSSLSGAAQAAEHHARRVLAGPDVTRLDAFRALRERGLGGGRVEVRLLRTRTDQVVDVTVAREDTAAPTLLTCAATRPAAPQGWRLAGLR